MDKKLGLWLLALSGICVASAQQDVNYIPLGRILELLPDNSSVTESLTGILWKIGPNKVTEWDQGFGPDVDYYGTYKERTELIKETGMLVITNMTKEDNGQYSVEINRRLQSKTYKIEVIKNVSKPSVAIRPPCSPQSTNCSVICEGDIKDSGPVTYRWRKDEMEWMVSGPNPAHWSITSDEEGKKVERVFCEMKNPVSVEQSDPCNNLFHPKAQQDVTYIPLEGTLQLIPDARSVPEPITGIVWKNVENEFAKWDEDNGTDFYGTYKERTELNNETGMLVIKNMTKEGSGEYSVEINSRMQCKTYKVEVIKNVPKPSVAIKPPCSSQSTNCSVICGGDIKDSGPVTYRWKKDDGEWMVSGPNAAHWSITSDEEGKKVEKLFCEMKNPFSVEQSGACNNLFHPKAQQDVTYIPLEGTLQLIPDARSVPESITGITWKNAENEFAKWDEDNGTDFYGTYKERMELNNETGMLVIKNMTKEGSGEYSVEINSRMQCKTYKVEVIKNVPKPSVAIKTPCSSQSTKCLFICGGDIKDSGPVTYRWKKDGGEWMVSGPNPAHWSITSDEEGKKVEMLFCEMKNQFSVEQSDPFKNPFYPNPENTSTGGIIGGIIVGVFLLAVLVLGYIYRDRIRDRIGDMLQSRVSEPV